MPRRNSRNRRTMPTPANHPQAVDETPEEAALRLVRTGKCSPAILDSRRVPFRLSRERRPDRPTRAAGARDA